MTIFQIIIVTLLYAIALAAAIYFTRPTLRRVTGALAGGAAAGLFGMGAIFFGNAMELWSVPISWTPAFLTLFYVGLAVSVSPIYLVTWRLARRFGWRGLAVFIGVVAIIGPPRDYMYAAMFPEWMVFAPGILPILADAAAYIGIVVLGHTAMSFIADSASDDPLARQTT